MRHIRSISMLIAGLVLFGIAGCSGQSNVSDEANEVGRTDASPGRDVSSDRDAAGSTGDTRTDGESDGPPDSDRDGHPDSSDNCPNAANPDQRDSDGDGTGDACERPYNPVRDRDGDGVPDIEDNCPDMTNRAQADADGDKIGDACDNCRKTPNYLQADANDDGTGDACTREPVGDICSTKSANFQRVKPNLYFVIDRSSSMSNNDGTGESRMKRAKRGLDEIADQLHDEARFGMSTYPCTRRRNACGQMNKEFLDMGSYTRQEIRQSYRRPNFTDDTCPWGDKSGLDGLDVEEGGKHLTETGAALDDVRQRELYNGTGSAGQQRTKRVILITDGNACGCGDKGCGSRQPATLEALQKLRNQKGIKTHVVGFNYSSNLLNQAAQAGGTDAGSPGGRRFYRASNASTLVQALKQISGRIISCSYTLQQPKSEIDENRIWVKIGGRAVAPDQYTYDASSKTLTLENQACQRLQNLKSSQSSNPLEIVLGCPARCPSQGDEQCNYVDDDCDGEVDEGCPTCHLLGTRCQRNADCCSGTCVGGGGGRMGTCQSG